MVVRILSFIPFLTCVWINFYLCQFGTCNETSSSMYPIFLFSVGLATCFNVIAFSAKAAFTNESCLLCQHRHHSWFIALAWVNLSSRRVTPRKTMLIRHFWFLRGTTIKDIWSLTISPSWNLCGPVSLKLKLILCYGMHWQSLIVVYLKYPSLTLCFW